mgnify:CR=1 FL=1
MYRTLGFVSRRFSDTPNDEKRNIEIVNIIIETLQEMLSDSDPRKALVTKDLITGRVGTVGLIGRGLIKESVVVIRKGAVHLIRGHMQKLSDWLYVEDHAKAIDMVQEQGKLFETYNIGGHNEKRN